MPALIAMLMLAAPDNPALTISGAATYANGMAPGNSIGVSAGVRHTRGSLSFGLEFQLLAPGSESTSTREIAQYVVVRLRDSVYGTRGMGVVGSLPVCLHQGSLSVCGLGAVGVVGVSDVNGGWLSWRPLLSAGLRIAGEYPENSSIRAQASAQVLAGIIRPGGGASFWSASPIQLGLSVGVVADAL